MSVKKKIPHDTGISPFALKGHVWVPHDWLSRFNEANVIQNNGPGTRSLVRFGTNGKRVFRKPTDPREVIEQWSAERHLEETKRFQSNRDAAAPMRVVKRVVEFPPGFFE